MHPVSTLCGVLLVVSMSATQVYVGTKSGSQNPCGWGAQQTEILCGGCATTKTCHMSNTDPSQSVPLDWLLIWTEGGQLGTSFRTDLTTTCRLNSQTSNRNIPRGDTEQFPDTQTFSLQYFLTTSCQLHFAITLEGAVRSWTLHVTGVTHTPTTTPTPTATSTSTITMTPTDTLTPTPSPTDTGTYTPYPTYTPTSTYSITATGPATSTPTSTPTTTVTTLPSYTPTYTPSTTETYTPTDTSSRTVSVSSTVTSSHTLTPSYTDTDTPSRSPTRTTTPTITPTVSQTPSRTSTPTTTTTTTATVTPSLTIPPTLTLSSTVTPTATVSSTSSSSTTPTPSSSPTTTSTPSPSCSCTPTVTRTTSATGSPSKSSSVTYSPTLTETLSRSPTDTETPTSNVTVTPTATHTTCPDWSQGAAVCGGECKFIINDEHHCGGCDEKCPPNYLCFEYMCVPDVEKLYYPCGSWAAHHGTETEYVLSSSEMTWQGCVQYCYNLNATLIGPIDNDLLEWLVPHVEFLTTARPGAWTSHYVNESNQWDSDGTATLPDDTTVWYGEVGKPEPNTAAYLKPPDIVKKTAEDNVRKLSSADVNDRNLCLCQRDFLVRDCEKNPCPSVECMEAQCIPHCGCRYTPTCLDLQQETQSGDNEVDAIFRRTFGLTELPRPALVYVSIRLVACRPTTVPEISMSEHNSTAMIQQESTMEGRNVYLFESITRFTKLPVVITVSSPDTRCPWNATGYVERKCTHNGQDCQPGEYCKGSSNSTSVKYNRCYRQDIPFWSTALTVSASLCVTAIGLIVLFIFLKPLLPGVGVSPYQGDPLKQDGTKNTVLLSVVLAVPGTHVQQSGDVCCKMLNRASHNGHPDAPFLLNCYTKYLKREPIRFAVHADIKKERVLPLLLDVLDKRKQHHTDILQLMVPLKPDGIDKFSEVEELLRDKRKVGHYIAVWKDTVGLEVMTAWAKQHQPHVQKRNEDKSSDSQPTTLGESVVRKSAAILNVSDISSIPPADLLPWVKQDGVKFQPVPGHAATILYDLCEACSKNPTAMTPHIDALFPTRELEPSVVSNAAVRRKMGRHVLQYLFKKKGNGKMPALFPAETADMLMHTWHDSKAEEFLRDLSERGEFASAFFHDQIVELVNEALQTDNTELVQLFKDFVVLDAPNAPELMPVPRIGFWGTAAMVKRLLDELTLLVTQPRISGAPKGLHATKQVGITVCKGRMIPTTEVLFTLPISTLAAHVVLCECGKLVINTTLQLGLHQRCSRFDQCSGEQLITILCKGFRSAAQAIIATLTLVSAIIPDWESDITFALLRLTAEEALKEATVRKYPSLCLARRHCHRFQGASDQFTTGHLVTNKDAYDVSDISVDGYVSAILVPEMNGAITKGYTDCMAPLPTPDTTCGMDSKQAQNIAKLKRYCPSFMSTSTEEEKCKAMIATVRSFSTKYGCWDFDIDAAIHQFRVQRMPDMDTCAKDAGCLFLYLYTRDSKFINDTLCSEDQSGVDIDPEAEEIPKENIFGDFMYCLHHCVTSLPVYHKTVYRCAFSPMSNAGTSGSEPLTTFINPGIWSASKSLEAASKHVTRGGILFVILPPHEAHDISDVSAHPDEEEVVITPSTLWTVLAFRAKRTNNNLEIIKSCLESAVDEDYFNQEHQTSLLTVDIYVVQAVASQSLPELLYTPHEAAEEPTQQSSSEPDSITLSSTASSPVTSNSDSTGRVWSTEELIYKYINNRTSWDNTSLNHIILQHLEGETPTGTDTSTQTAGSCHSLLRTPAGLQGPKALFCGAQKHKAHRNAAECANYEPLHCIDSLEQACSTANPSKLKHPGAADVFVLLPKKGESIHSLGMDLTGHGWKGEFLVPRLTKWRVEDHILPGEERKHPVLVKHSGQTPEIVAHYQPDSLHVYVVRQVGLIELRAADG